MLSILAATGSLIGDESLVDIKGNPLMLIPVIIFFFIMLASPAIQTYLSNLENKYIGLLFPLFTFICFGVIMIVVDAHPILALLMTFGVPLSLVIFHFIIRNNRHF